jgi:hypothetical protein
LLRIDNYTIQNFIRCLGAASSSAGGTYLAHKHSLSHERKITYPRRRQYSRSPYHWGMWIIGVCGVVPAGALYWLMRPTVLPNPGVNAYRPPKPDSTFPRIVRDTRDPHTLSIAVAGEGARRLDLTTVVQQRRQRTVRANTFQKQPSSPARAPGAPVISWANRDHSFGTWYR